MELDIKQMVAMVDIVAEEKNLPKEVVIDVIEQSIAAAWRKDNGDKDMDVRCELDLNTGEAFVYVSRTVVEDDVAYIPATEIPLSEAKGKQLGDIVEEKIKVTGFGRVASQTAKQVVTQRLREAERDAVLALYEDRIGEVEHAQDREGIDQLDQDRELRSSVGCLQGMCSQILWMSREYLPQILS